MEALSDHILTLHYKRSPAVCSSWVHIILYVSLRGKNKGLLWEFSKHLPSYQPLRVLNARSRWGYFCDHTDSSVGTCSPSESLESSQAGGLHVGLRGTEPRVPGRGEPDGTSAAPLSAFQTHREHRLNEPTPTEESNEYQRNKPL